MDPSFDRKRDFAAWRNLASQCCLLAALALCLTSGALRAADDEAPKNAPLRVAVYDVPPYGYVDTDGSIAGVSVDLWRRIAGEMEVDFKLIPVADMETVLSGLERGRYDEGLLSPANMAIALPENSPWRRPIDRALIKIVNGPEWRSLEEKFFLR
ncbi:substrate-binding periplasmic protein [Rhodoblastus sp.]|uniref:substrate-binding periplasmic protein n=1 Tax=Rhodoblastus sp. TaxID=1962975 RepID=UPI003F9CA335